MKKLIIACLLAAPVTAAYAQYTGPSVQASATTVKQLRDTGTDDQPVVLRGHIVKHVGDKKYQFADSTGEMLVKIEPKRWPAGQPVNEADTVELTGKYDKEVIGTSKVKVYTVKMVR